MSCNKQLFVVHLRHSELLEIGGFSETFSQFYLIASSQEEAENRAQQLPVVATKQTKLIAVQVLNKVDGHRIVLQPA